MWQKFQLFCPATREDFSRWKLLEITDLPSINSGLHWSSRSSWKAWSCGNIDSLQWIIYSRYRSLYVCWLSYSISHFRYAVCCTSWRYSSSEFFQSILIEISRIIFFYSYCVLIHMCTACLRYLLILIFEKKEVLLFWNFFGKLLDSILQVMN
jgi:hypothetical protein